MAKNGAQVVDDVVKAGWKTTGNFRKLSTVIDTALLVVDTIDLGVTIMDLVQNKGSDAAKDLREKAKEIEDVFYTVIGT